MMVAERSNTAKRYSKMQSPSERDRKPWWLSNRKMVEKYVREARSLIASEEMEDAVGLIDAALSLSPRCEVALELKARTLLHLRRFKEVADMLQDCIPSLKIANEEGLGFGPDSTSSTNLRASLLNPSNGEFVVADHSFKCFSVSDLKKKVMTGLFKDCEKKGQWRYIVLGTACCHLGLMEDAMVLLQTGKRLSTAEFRRQSNSWSDDSFSLSHRTAADSPARNSSSEGESVTSLISHIKVLLRRRASALAAVEAGLHAEAIRHLTKMVESRRGAPQGFLSECYLQRGGAYRAAGRIAEAIADCNKALALEPACIPALELRASLYESIRCLPDSLHDLEHLKLLYNSIARERKVQGRAWRHMRVRYGEIPGKLCALGGRMQELKRRVAAGEMGTNADYFSLMGLRRGCTKMELDRAHRLLCLRHKPDKATSFMERCEFADERDLDSIRDRAKMSALQLYRLIQRGYTHLTAVIKEEEGRAATVEQQPIVSPCNRTRKPVKKPAPPVMLSGCPNPSVFQGVFCRDLGTVGSLLSQAGFNRPITVKYEALSC